jgi:hypothetical protein
LSTQWCTEISYNKWKNRNRFVDIVWVGIVHSQFNRVDLFWSLCFEYEWNKRRTTKDFFAVVSFEFNRLENLPLSGTSFWD